MILGAMAIVSDWVHFYLAAIKIKVWIVVKTIVGITMRLEMLIKKSNQFGTDQVSGNDQDILYKSSCYCQ